MDINTLEISPTRLNQFLKCPYSYYLSTVKRITPKFKNQIIIDTGSIIHKVIETYYDIYPPIHKIKSTVDEIKQLADKKLNISEPMRRIVDKSLDNFISFEEKRRNKLDVKPLSELDIRIKNNDVIERGVPDLFIKEPKVVVDFKTSNLHDIYDGYKIQLNFYQRLIKEKYGFRPKTYLFYLLSNDLIEVEYSPECDKIIEDGIMSILTAFEEDFFFKDESSCNDCPYRYYCDGEKNDG